MANIPPPPLRETDHNSMLWKMWFTQLTKKVATLIDSPGVDNFASIDADGNIQDSGYDATSFLGAIHDHEDAAGLGQLDHGLALTGLTDDDHTQYLKEKASGGVAAEVPTHTHADAANAGTVDHGVLTGLTDDDHTDYLNNTRHDTRTRHGASVVDLLGDATTGRILKQAQITIDNGTNANTLKCTVASIWNGDAIGETDNVAKGATTGNFTLDAAGEYLIIEASGLTGNIIMAQGVLSSNPSGTGATLDLKVDTNDIKLALRNSTASTLLDLTALVDVGAPIEIYVLYLTSA